MIKVNDYQIKSAKRTVVSYSIMLIIFAIVFIKFIFPLSSFNSEFGKALGFGILIVYAIYAMIWFYFVNSFTESIKYLRKITKEYYVLNLLSSEIYNLKFEPYKSLEKDDILYSNLISDKSSFFKNNYIRGNYKDLEFEQCDVLAKSFLNKRKILFDGRIVAVPLNRTFVGKILVIEKKYNAVSQNDIVNLKQESFENDSFDSKFDIFTSDRELLYNVVNSEVRKAIVDFFDKHYGQIAYSFINGDLYVAVNNDEKYKSIMENSKEKDIKCNIDSTFDLLEHISEVVGASKDVFFEKRKTSRFLDRL